MTWFIIGVLTGSLAGFLTAAMLAVGARADLRAELADCQQRVRRLADEEHA